MRPSFRPVPLVLALLLGMASPALALAAPAGQRSAHGTLGRAADGAALGPVGSAASLAPLRVPYVSQLEPVAGLGERVGLYACGPASAAMVAAYMTGTAPQLGRAEAAMGGRALVGPGSQPWQVAEAIRLLAPGAQADAAEAGSADAAWALLRRELAAGRPVVALVRPSWFATPINHFVVVTGLDEPRGLVRFDDPLAGSGVSLAAPAFLRAWRAARGGHPFTYVWVAGEAAAGSDALSRAAPAAQQRGPASSESVERQSALVPGELARVTATSLRVHRTATPDAPIVAYLQRDATARVVDRSGEWVLLHLPDGNGWAAAAYLTSD